jgi:hypothetical protein
MGTNGEIKGAMEKNIIEITDFASGTRTLIGLKDTQSGHSGGDTGIIRAFIRQLQNDNVPAGLTSARASLQSHLMAFSAERSRLENRVIDLSEYDDMIVGNGGMLHE